MNRHLVRKFLPAAGQMRKSRVYTLVVMLAIAATAVAVVAPLFIAYRDDSGRVQSATADPTLNANNQFFNAGLGTNGQACVTCHQPFDGFDISLNTIQSAFLRTVFRPTLDPLFRPNDTANNPNITDSRNPFKRLRDYSLFLELGVARIAKNFPATTDFSVQFLGDTNKFGTLPNLADPQRPGVPNLSLFRRPLVNTNVHLDSAVLWDGRANITDIPTQVQGAVRTLLLGSGNDAAANQDVANFMLGVFTDQVSDNKAGKLDAAGASGGLQNLLAQATGCTAGSCAVNDGTFFNLYNAWASLPNDSKRNAARLSIARGQAVFDSHGCKGCHSATNLGNNPSATFRPRIGTDSPDIIAHLMAGDGVVPGSDPHPHPELQVLLDRVNKLPLYCLRPNTDPTPVSTVPCGSDPINHPLDDRTTDPGAAMVTGLFANVGGFKPPILRDLAARSPYFHAGAAPSIEDLINFYNARFNFGLTDQDKADLAAFLESL